MVFVVAHESLPSDLAAHLLKDAVSPLLEAGRNEKMVQRLRQPAS
jgi:hypothetical protein